MIGMMVFVTTVSGNSSMLSLEQQYSSELGIVFQLVESSEADLIPDMLKHYFKPSSNAGFLTKNAADAYAELRKYNVNVLKDMNLSIYIVEPNNVIATGMAYYSSNKNECKIFLTNYDGWVRDTVNRTIHHEIFHCYDKSGSKADEWEAKFDSSPYVLDAWADMNDGVMYVNYASEDIAEYFAAAMINTFDYVDGTQRRYQRDSFLEAKKLEIAKYVNYFSNPASVTSPVEDSVKQDPVVKEGAIKTWKNGRLAKIEIYAAGNDMVIYEFDYINKTYTISQNNQIVYFGDLS